MTLYNVIKMHMQTGSIKSTFPCFKNEGFFLLKKELIKKKNGTMKN